jgi:hypothetical protein
MQFQLCGNIQMVHFISTCRLSTVYCQLYGYVLYRWLGQELHGRALAGQKMLLVIHGCQIMQYRSNNEFLEIDDLCTNVV